MWKTMHLAMITGGVTGVSQRAVKERCLNLIKTYRSSNRLDEWKTGDAGDFAEKEQILCDILSYKEDAKKRGPASESKTDDVPKQARKDTKFQFAASHSLKKRKILSTFTGSENQESSCPQDQPSVTSEKMREAEEAAGDPHDGPAPSVVRERTSWNYMVKSFLGDVESQRAQENSLREQELAVQQDKLALDRKREERALIESEEKQKLEKERLELEKLKEETDRRR